MTKQTQEKSQKQSFNFELISEYIIENIESILDYFGITYIKSRNRIVSCCPVHGGDNPNGFNIYTKGVGNWLCFTHQCHEKYGTSKGASLISLIQILLSQGGRNYSIADTISWIKQFLSISDNIIVNYSQNHDFIKLCSTLSEKTSNNIQKTGLNKNVLNKLDTPVYYINRGYSKEILQKYGVGQCNDAQKEMYERVIVPCFNDENTNILGFTCRSVYEKCNTCKFYHNPKRRCPITNFEQIKCSKWRHSKNFSVDNYLYNFCFAKNYIKQLRTAIIVEGPGDIWKLEEANIKNAVATLRVSLLTGQNKKLNLIGTENLILMGDSDEAGKLARIKMIEEYSRFYNIYTIDLPTKDVGELTGEYINEKIKPILNSI